MGMENWIERKNKCGTNEIIYFGRETIMLKIIF